MNVLRTVSEVSVLTCDLEANSLLASGNWILLDAGIRDEYYFEGSGPDLRWRKTLTFVLGRITKEPESDAQPG